MQELYNLSAEQSILGSILIDSKVILEANQVNLSARDFYASEHQIIYESMKKIFAENTEVDLITLVNELENIGRIDQIGGTAYISALVTSVPTSSNAIYYIKIVKELTYQMMMEWFVKTVANIEDIRRCKNNFGEYLKVTKEAHEIIAEWTRDKFYIFSKDVGADEAHLSGVIEHLAVKKATKLFVLDNLMTLECSGSDKYEKQINTVKMLKSLAKKYDLAIILVAHPNKSSIMNREPNVFEISGASEIPNLADYVLKLERGEDKTVVSVLKNRITGIQKKSLNLKFDANRRRFYTKNKDELSRDYGYRVKVD